MLIGLNLDLWSYSLVDKAILEFGKLIVWEEDHNHMARALVKVRVIGLDSIPWFFNFLEGKDPESDNWTVQCEIILTRMLGALPQDEDFPPDDPDDVDPHQFDFLVLASQDMALHIHQRHQTSSMLSMLMLPI